MRIIKNKKLIFNFILILFFIIPEICLAQDNSYTNSFLIYFDLKPLNLSLQSNGFGFGISFEYLFNNFFGLNLKFEHMNFKDEKTYLYSLLLGIRFYFQQYAPYKFFLGFFPLFFYGWNNSLITKTFGLNINFGYKFGIFKILNIKNNFIKDLFLEIYFEYIYLYNQEIVYGISPGINIGIIF